MVVIGLLVCPVGVSKNTKKDRTQKVTENALPMQTPFPSSHINQILHVGLYPRYLSWFQVSLRSVEKCGSCGGQNFGLPIDLAHRFYSSLLLSHKPWFTINFCIYITIFISSLTFVQNWQQLVQLGTMLNCIIWIRFSGYCGTSHM